MTFSHNTYRFARRRSAIPLAHIKRVNGDSPHTLTCRTGVPFAERRFNPRNTDIIAVVDLVHSTRAALLS